MRAPRYRRLFRLATQSDERVREEMSEEIRFHVETRAAQFRSEGMSDAEALAEATRRFGSGDAALRLETSAVRRSIRLRNHDWRHAIAMDVAFALRGMRRAPMFTLAVLGTLALGIGANIAIFSVVRGVLMTSLPYGRPDRVVAIWNHWPGWPRAWASQPEVYDYASDTTAFSRVAAFTNAALNVTSGEGEPERVGAGFIQQSLLDVAGVQPLLGRSFTTAEDTPNGPRSVMLLEDYWRRRFGADPGIIGKPVEMNKRSYVVVGILPSAFRLPSEFSGDHAVVFLPLQLGAPDEAQRSSHGFSVMARLAPGVTIAQAQQRLNAVVARLNRSSNNYGPEFGATVIPMSDEVRGPVRAALYLLFGAVSFVLLIACANVASLLLARAESRSREIAIRTAIGAGRTRIIVQFLIESLVLAVAGGALGLLLAAAILRGLTKLNLVNLPRLDAIHLDGGVFVYAAAITLVTGLAFGLAPVARLTGRVVPFEFLRQGHSQAGNRSGLRLRQMLISIELALAVIALTGAALMTRSFARLASVSPGFSSDHVLTMWLSPPSAKYPTSSTVRAFYAQLLDRVRELPGVASAGASSGIPLSSTLGDWAFAIDGTPPRRMGEHPPTADWQSVTDGYLESLRLPLIRGRTLRPADRMDAAPVALINESLAQLYFRDSSALGKSVQLGGPADTAHRTIVGIVGDVRFNRLDEPPRPTMYVSHAQSMSSLPDSAGGAPRTLVLAIRTQGDPVALVAPIRELMKAYDPDIPLANIRTMGDIVDGSMSTRKFATILLLAFGGAALLLAALGVYAVTSFAVAQRSAEIGVRVALGARSTQVVRLMIWQGMLPVLIGLGAGIVVAAAGTRVMQGLLYSVGATDPMSFAIAISTLLAVSLLANWRPARRAAMVDPVVALRAE
jgi:putative ABC transport system permease protein